MISVVRAGYIGILAWTIAALYVRRAHRRFPLFFGYLIVCLMASISYTTSVDLQSRAWWQTHWLPWQPLLLIGFCGSLVEVMIWTSIKLYPIETGRLLTFLASTAATGVLLAFRPCENPSFIQAIAEIRRYIDLAAALCLMAGAGYWWIRPFHLWKDARRHAGIMTVYVVIQAAVGLANQAAPEHWAAWDLAGYFFSAACLVLWSVSIRPGSRPVHA